MANHGNPRECLSSNSQFLALSAYLPPHVMSKFEGFGLSREKLDIVPTEQYLQKLFQKCFDDMKRYGNAENLAENLKIFRNFTGSHRELQADHCRLFNTSPILYEGRSNSTDPKFMSKQDMIIQVQNVILRSFDFVAEPITVAILIAILKNYEEQQLSSVCEFIPIDQSVYEAVELKIEKLLLQKQRNHWMDMTCPPPVKFTYKEILERIKTFVPGWEDQKCSEISNHLQEMCRMNPPKQKQKLYSWFLNSVKGIHDTVLGVLCDAPTIFLPNQMTKSLKKPIMLRLFQDENRKFVMKKDLEQLFPMEKDDDEKILKTLDEKEVLKMIEKLREQPYLLMTPIVRAKHCARPIRTPDVGYCKLASDLLFEVLQDLIFGEKLFQKLKISEWNKVEQFFEKLEHFFNANETQVYFIRSSAFEPEKSWIFNFFKDFSNRPAKTISTVKPTGFTTEDLKMELESIGLKNLFPEITEHAQLIYENVWKERTSKVLATSDLFDAVEQCQLMCVLKRLPKLSAFLHQQNACHRVPGRLCCLGTSETSTQSTLKFRETTWKSINLQEVHFKDIPGIGKDRGMLDKTMKCPGPLKLLYNDSAIHILLSCYFPDDLKLQRSIYNEFQAKRGAKKKVFLLSIEELQEVLEALEEEGETDLKIRTSQAFELLRNLHEFCQKSLKTKKKLYLRTFSQGIVEEEHRRFAFLEEAFELIPEALKQQKDCVDHRKIEKLKVQYSQEHGDIIDMTIFKSLLEHLDIDKSLITIVPDPFHTDSLRQAPLSPTVTVYGPLRQEFMDPVLAMFRIFQQVVCDVDWSLEDLDGKHSKEAFKKEILEQMETCSRFPFFAPDGWAKTAIKKLKKNPNYQERKKQKLLTPNIVLHDKDTITLSFFLSLCDKYRVNYFCPPHITKEQLDDTSLLAWKGRLLFFNAYVSLFFGEEATNQKVVQMVRAGINRKTLLPDWTHEAQFMEAITVNDSEVLREVLAFSKNKEKRSKLKRIEIVSPAPSASVDHQENPENPAPKDVSKDPSKDPRESASCNKCSRTSNLCKEVSSQLKSSENKVEKLKKKLAAAEKERDELKVKKSQKEVEQENQELKRQVETQKNLEEENQNLRLELETALLNLEESTQQHAAEKEELEASNAEKDNRIRLLKPHVSQQIKEGFNLRLSIEVRRVLLGLQDQQDVLRMQDLPGKASQQVFELTTISTDPQVKAFAEHHLRKLRQEFVEYETKVVSNIGLIQSDPLITLAEIPEVPDLPTLPPVFYEELKKAHDLKNAQLDKECVVCFTEDDKPYLKCSGCLKKVHMWCGRKWWKKSGTRDCPHCRIVTNNWDV